MRNSDKEFVQRILSPSEYPTLDNGDGSYSTHSMAWSDIDDGHIVYPTVVFKKGKLVRLDDDAAVDHALKTGKYIKFAKPEDADAFSQDYKKFWDGK